MVSKAVEPIRIEAAVAVPAKLAITNPSEVSVVSPALVKSTSMPLAALKVVVPVPVLTVVEVA